MAAAVRAYVEFTPPHSLQEESGKVVLRVDLSAEGFRKEQLRVQKDNLGRLRISGERQLRADSNRWRRFSKDFHVPEGCDASAVRARLDKGGILLITMPRLSPAPAKEHTAATGANNAGGVDAREKQKNRASARQEAPPAAAGTGEQNKEDNKEGQDAGVASTERRDQEEQHLMSNEAGGAASTGRQEHGFARSRSGMVWAIVAVVLAMIGAGLYARFRLMDPSAETTPAGTEILALPDN